MNKLPISPADALRDPISAMEPDPRTSMFSDQTPPSLAAHHAWVASIQISTTVPEPVAIQFDTARNLYLYSWHVYRFYMVAAVQALATLEFGLRERLPKRLPKEYQWQKEPSLSGLLRYAADQGLIRNEGFRRWHQAAEVQARSRLSAEAVRTMISQGLDSIDIDDDAPLEITPEDQQWDLVAGLSESLPKLRNHLAHGSSTLTPQVRGTLELVAEILCQLYPEEPTTESR